MLKKITSIVTIIAVMFLVASAVAEDKAQPSIVKTNSDASSKKGDFVRGIKLWKDTCARCHNMRDPKDFRDDLWEVTMAHMRVRAGISGQEARDILTFLQQSN